MIMELIERAICQLFSIVYKQASSSPFDVKGVKTRATTKDILEAVEHSRSRESVLKR